MLKFNRSQTKMKRTETGSTANVSAVAAPSKLAPQAGVAAVRAATERPTSAGYGRTDFAMPPTSPEWTERTKQLYAYVAWVNSQLRKKLGCRLVTDLCTDFQDGTTMAHLIDIIGGKRVPGIDYNPLTIQTKRQNIERILYFMKFQNMEIHNVTAKDVVEGRLKATMLLIQAVAKHYKPNPVVTPKTGGQRSNPAPALSPAGYRSLDRPKNFPRTGREVQSTPTTPVSAGSSLSLHVLPMHRGGQYPELHRSQTLDRKPMSSYTCRTLSWNNYYSLNETTVRRPGDDDDYAGTDSDVSGKDSPILSQNRSSSLLIENGRWTIGKEPTSNGSRKLEVVVGRTAGDSFSKNADLRRSLPCLLNKSDLEGYRDYENYPPLEIVETPTQPSVNTKLLSPHGAADTAADVRNQGTNTFAGTSAEGKLVALQNYLQQTSDKCHDLNTSLQRTKQECSTLEDVKSNLQSRVAEQDKFILEMQKEMERLLLEKQSLETEKEELMQNVELKEQQIGDLRRQLGTKDKVIHQQKSQFEDAVRNLTSTNKAKACLTARLTDQDRKIAFLEQVRTNSKTPMREELQVVRDALHSLRSSFKGTEPQHHTIDTLEQSFGLLMERLHLSEINKMTSNQTEGKRLNFDSTGDPRRFPVTSYGLCLQQLDHPSSITKVVYFTDKAITPFMSSINKRLGEIRLRDFKAMFDRPGNYRYHFKSADPEYGMVKEEILQDDDILPGWDGKIIAWVADDHLL